MSTQSSILKTLEPISRTRIYDLLIDAGFDVSDWSSSKGHTASNPKYCYNWSFSDPNRVAVNVWFEELITEDDGSIIHKINHTKFTNRHKQAHRERASKVIQHLTAARQLDLPIHVIICSGNRYEIDGEDETTPSSKVKKRLLDPMNWHVSSYDEDSGDIVLKRGAAQKQHHYIDQFTIGDNEHQRLTIASVYSRSATVRSQALNRSGGKCEYCGEEGFKTVDGRLYLETHHIIPLHQQGKDNIYNVIALCANHHRQAHYGQNQQLLQKEFQRIVTSNTIPIR